MKPFRFTLEPLRVVRERQEREALERYGLALMEVNRCKAEVARIEREMQWLQDESKLRLLKGSLSALIVQQQLYGTHLEECRKKALAEVADSEAKAKKAMQEMLLARREREIVDKFREKQRALYDRAMTLEEQKLLDELAGRRSDFALNWRSQN
jgi:flagellar export protein FliJ